MVIQLVTLLVAALSVVDRASISSILHILELKYLPSISLLSGSSLGSAIKFVRINNAIMYYYVHYKMEDLNHCYKEPSSDCGRCQKGS